MGTKTGSQKAAARAALAMAATMFALMLAALAWTTPAEAQVDPYAEETPEVLPTIIRRVEVEQPPAPAAQPQPPPTGLPVTGADLTLFVGTGLAAIATGTLIVRRVRARRSRE